MTVQHTPSSQKFHYDRWLGLLGPYLTRTKCELIQRVQLKEGRSCSFKCSKSPRDCSLGSSTSYLGLLPLWAVGKRIFQLITHGGADMHSACPGAERVTKSTKWRRKWGTLRCSPTPEGRTAKRKLHVVSQRFLNAGYYGRTMPCLW